MTLREGGSGRDGTAPKGRQRNGRRGRQAEPRRPRDHAPCHDSTGPGISPGDVVVHHHVWSPRPTIRTPDTLTAGDSRPETHSGPDRPTHFWTCRSIFLHRTVARYPTRRSGRHAAGRSSRCSRRVPSQSSRSSLRVEAEPAIPINGRPGGSSAAAARRPRGSEADLLPLGYRVGKRCPRTGPACPQGGDLQKWAVSDLGGPHLRQYLRSPAESNRPAHCPAALGCNPRPARTAPLRQGRASPWQGRQPGSRARPPCDPVVRSRRGGRSLGGHADGGNRQRAAWTVSWPSPSPRNDGHSCTG
jgi:hypothetical protein